MGSIDHGHRPGPILVAAKDAGGCNAITPVLKMLETAGFDLRVYSDGPAVDILQHEGFSPQRVCYDESLNNRENLYQIEGIFNETHPLLLLTGNSWGASIEDRFIAVARQMGVKSVGVLDSWLLYDEKFGDGTDPWRYLPEKLLVMDDLARDEMIRLGAPAERLLALGQPQFDILAGKRMGFGSCEKQAVLDQFGVTPGDMFVLFLSQAMTDFYGDGPKDPRYPGYTEYIVLNLLMEALSNLETRHGRRIRLAVKLHPREDAQKYASHGVSVVKEFDPYSLLLSADLTVGMDTILLVEACLLGCLNLSFQPDLRREDHLLTNKLGIGEWCYSAEKLEDKIGRLLFEPIHRETTLNRMSQFQVAYGASQRVFDFVVDAMPNCPK